jgi:hypothetical protein
MTVVNSKHLNPFDITEKQQGENHLQQLFQNYPASKYYIKKRNIFWVYFKFDI